MYKQIRKYTAAEQEAFLVRQCDKLWRRIVLLRADCTCEICGAPNGTTRTGEIVWVQACHIIGRRDRAMRWDERNGVAGCQDCHKHHIIMDWLRRTDPVRYAWIIQQKQKQVSKNTVSLTQVLQRLQEVA